MSFNFHKQPFWQPFWGLPMVSSQHETATIKPSTLHRFRPRFVARWVLDTDGRLERRWRATTRRIRPR